MEEELDEATLWRSACFNAAYKFARECQELHRTNPQSESALDLIMNALMTELWDHCFSQTEIRKAFNDAVADMPRYAAGEERRS